MLFRTIASAFFLDKSPRTALRTLALRASTSDIAAFDERTRGALGFPKSDREVLCTIWEAFGKTWVIIDDVEPLRCLQLYSSAARYLDAARSARESMDLDINGPLVEYIRTFRGACQSLSPRAAFLDTRPHYEDEDWENKEGSRTFVLAQVPMVAACDADGLVARRFSLLYLNTEMLTCLSPVQSASEQDVLELPNGRLIIARSGPRGFA